MTATKHNEEEAIGKTYDWTVTRRLLRYLKPYIGLVIPALFLTILLNIVGNLQPWFTKNAIDGFIATRQIEGLWIFVAAFFGVFLLRFIFS